MSGLTSSEMIAAATAEIGYAEKRGGKTKYGLWYGNRVNNAMFDTAAWCGMFLGWCSKQAGGDEALTATGLFAYTPWWAHWFAKNSRFDNKPTRGAIGFIDWGKGRGASMDAIDHVVLVTGVTNRGEIVTIEGNTSNAVQKHYRQYRNFVGFGHPKYASVGSIKPAKPADPAKATSSTHPFPLPAGHWFGVPMAILACHSGKTAADRVKVKQLQEALNTRGHDLVVDGEFGSKTLAAVRDFQRVSGLKIDGQAGILTWRALWA